MILQIKPLSQFLPHFLIRMRCRPVAYGRYGRSIVGKQAQQNQGSTHRMEVVR